MSPTIRASEEGAKPRSGIRRIVCESIIAGFAEALVLHAKCR